MKLKYNFVVRDVGGSPVAVAVGKDNAKFNGMIKLNASGEFIFKMLCEDTTVDEIVFALLEKYDIIVEVAQQTVVEYIDNFRKNNLITE